MKTTTIAALAVAFMTVATTFAATVPAQAGSCQGVVRGLSNTYNLARGSGFLAIRAQPTTRARMVGQTFNGNVLEIDRRRGNWLFVWDSGSGKQGWVYAKYVRRGCDGV